MGPATLAAAGRGPDAPAAAPRPGQPPGEDAQDGGRGEGRTPAAAAPNLAAPPLLLPATIKPKKRKRKDASGPTGPPPSGEDCRDLIYGAQVRERGRAGRRWGGSLSQ